MSYDLTFHTPNGEPRPGQEAIQRYFKGRPNYTVEELTACYENSDTDVYFHFSFGEPDLDLEDEESVPAEVSFEINYNRPSIFGIEAATEVQALIDRFGFNVDDPQGGKIYKSAEYTCDEFIRLWNHGNLAGLRVACEENTVALSMPGKRLRAIWQWNYSRSRRQREVGEEQFVPRIFVMQSAAGIGTCIVWTDVVPGVLPDVDTALVLLEQHKRFLERQPPLLRIPFGELRPFLTEIAEPEGLMNEWHTTYAKLPRKLLKFVKKYRRVDDDFSIIPLCDVIDSELIEEARSGSSDR